MEEASRFGILSTGEDGFINVSSRKAQGAQVRPRLHGHLHLQLEEAAQYLIEDEADPNSSKDFGKNIIPKMLADRAE